METNSIDKKLLLFQSEIETIKKDGQNTFFKKSNGKASTYATLPHILSEVKPLLNKLGCLITQPIIDNTVLTIIKDVETGDCRESGLVLPTNLNAQQVGSAITYFRRYTLCSLLSLEIDEDDDGNAASKKPEPKIEPQKPAEQPSKPYLNRGTKAFNQAIEKLSAGTLTIETLETAYTLAPEVKTELINQSKKVTA